MTHMGSIIRKYFQTGPLLNAETQRKKVMLCPETIYYE